MDASGAAFWLKSAAGLLALPSTLLLVAAPVLLVIAEFRAAARQAPLARRLALTCTALSLLLSTPAVAGWLIGRIEAQAGPALDEAGAAGLMRSARAPQAVVVLGGGLRRDERERPEPVRLHERTAIRIAAGVRIARWTGLPLLVSGGAPLVGGLSEAEVMARFAARDLGMPVRWVESGSRDTRENATASSAMLRAAGIRRVILVTEAYHMPRAARAFAESGLTISAAPVGYVAAQGYPQPFAWIPQARAARVSELALHEIVGGIWYRIAHWFGGDAQPSREMTR